MLLKRKNYYKPCIQPSKLKSQHDVNNKNKAIKNLKFIIHVPGFGINFSDSGLKKTKM